jgi:triosephosphate isomerase (TIM)
MNPNRKPLISGNWKMNLNHFEAIQNVQKISWALKPEDYQSAEISLHPPFTDIRSVQTLLDADHIPMKLGAQNAHWEDSGAFTGEVSAAMLSKLNVSYVIVGHSERRAQFGETDEIVAAKVAVVLKNEMAPIVCVGETAQEREEGRTEEVVTTQVQAALGSVKANEAERLVVAYEPVWAIGTGTPATADDAQLMCSNVRQLVNERLGQDAAEKVRVQYGASVKGRNAKDFLAAADVDGLLVGGASLDPEDFAKIVAAVHDPAITS